MTTGMTAMPSLSAIRAFEAAARLLSFTRAAAELGMTQAAVSWQVKALERRLGVPLFERRRSGLVLTATARDLLPEVGRSLEQLRNAFDRAGGRPRSPSLLRVSASPTFAHAWLAPRLGAFHERHPDIATQLEASPELADLGGGAADIAIRRGKGSWPSLTSRHLMPVVLAPFGAPRLAGDGAWLSIPEMTRLPLLQPVAMWRRWLAHVGADPGLLPDRPSARYLNQHMVIQAASAGQGVALLNPAFCADALAAGRLARLRPEDLVSADDGYWLVHGEGRAARTVEKFRDWILHEAGGAGSTVGGPAPTGAS